MEGKKLKINCGTCDATGVTEEALAGYGEVRVNCGSMLVTPEANRVLLSHGVRFNTGSVISVPDGARVVSKTGSFTLEAGDMPSEPTVLIVTGNLAVKEGAGEALNAYAAVHVIGRVTCPRSLANRVHVTGSETVYPDGYVLVEDDVKLNKLSGLRWAGKKVFTSDAVIIDEDADLDALIKSGAVFACEKAVVPEKLLERAMPLLELSSDAELIVLPEGAVYVDGSRTLTRALIRKGKRLWVDGGLAVTRREAELLSELEYLHVAGRAIIPEELEESFFKLSPECEDVFTYRGELVYKQDEVKVNKPFLSRYGFVTVMDCDAVELDGKLTDGEIRAGLAIHHCDAVICSDDQIEAARAVCEDVDYIGDGENGPEEDEDPDEVSINCGMYKF